MRLIYTFSGFSNPFVLWKTIEEEFLDLSSAPACVVGNQKNRTLFAPAHVQYSTDEMRQL